MNARKKYFADFFHYLGIGFISGGISHGFFSGGRSLLMILIGCVLFLWGEYLQDEEKNKQYLHILFIGIVYSLGIGMINGGLQHFLDSPERSLWIVPLGFILSIAIYHKKIEISWTEMKPHIPHLLIFGALISISLGGLYAIGIDAILGELSPHTH